jgi:hypothetical protein
VTKAEAISLEPGPHKTVLKSRDGVLVGFVDGESNVVWNGRGTMRPSNKRMKLTRRRWIGSEA